MTDAARDARVPRMALFRRRSASRMCQRRRLGDPGARGNMLGALLVGTRVGAAGGGEPAAHTALREGERAALDDVPLLDGVVIHAPNMKPRRDLAQPRRDNGAQPKRPDT